MNLNQYQAMKFLSGCRRIIGKGAGEDVERQDPDQDRQKDSSSGKGKNSQSRDAFDNVGQLFPDLQLFFLSEGTFCRLEHQVIKLLCLLNFSKNSVGIQFDLGHYLVVHVILKLPG